MNLFDTRTIFMLCGIMSGLMALVLFFLRRGYPPSIKGIEDWSGALVAMFLAGALTALRGVISDFLSISISNLVYLVGLYWSYYGSQRFLGKTPRPAPWLVFIAALEVVHGWFTYMNPNVPARILVVNLGGAVIMAAQVWLLAGYRSPGLPKLLTFGALVSGTLLQVARSAMVWVGPADTGILTLEPIHQIYATGFAFSVLVYAIGVILLATDKLRHELELLATRDSLTGALTRRNWNETCATEFQRCLRSGRHMAVLMLDLDHFKAVNDNFGHQAGDKVLVNFVNMVNGLLRQNDRLGRFGGEEFILLLPETSLEQALSVADRIRQQAESSAKPACTVSIGVAANQGEADAVDAMLSRADAAMYRAKAKGRNCVEAG